MHIQVNAVCGDHINHSLFGEGIITEIADKFIKVDFDDKKNWKAARWPHDNIITNGKPLCELVFDGPIGDYEFFFEYVAIAASPNSNPLTKNYHIFHGITELEASIKLRETVTAYHHYDTGFFILKVTKL